MLMLLFVLAMPVVIVWGLAQLSNTGNGAEGQAISDLAHWKDALEVYKEQEGEYPADDSLLDGRGLETVIATLHADAEQDLLWLRDPWGMPYRYRWVSKYRYQLGTTGLDRRFGKKKEETIHFGEGDDITIENGRM